MQLAAKYGVTAKAVRDIWNLRTWAVRVMMCSCLTVLLTVLRATWVLFLQVHADQRPPHTVGDAPHGCRRTTRNFPAPVRILQAPRRKSLQTVFTVPHLQRRGRPPGRLNISQTSCTSDPLQPHTTPSQRAIRRGCRCGERPGGCTGCLDCGSDGRRSGLGAHPRCGGSRVGWGPRTGQCP